MRAVNRLLSGETGVELYSTDWRRDSRADSGAEPQALLNRQIVDGSDIVLAIFYKRFDSPTSKYGSGTEEEIRLGLEQKKTVLLYTWEPPTGYVSAEEDQLDSIQQLKADLGRSVMYKSFKDTGDLEEKVRHDLTRLMLDLEGGGRSPRPALTLKCIDSSGDLAEDDLVVQKGFARKKLNSAAFDHLVREAFEKVAASPVYRPEPIEPSAPALEENDEAPANLSASLSSAALVEQYPGIAAAVSQMREMQKSLRDSATWSAMQPEPIEFEKDDKAMVLGQLAELGVEPPEDLFYVGNLDTVPSLASIYGPSRTLVGAEDEKAKYKALQVLVKECRLRRDYRTFHDSLASIGGIALVLANDGGQPATHANVEVAVPTNALVPHDEAPIPSNYFIGHSLDEDDDLGRFVRHLFSIKKPPSHRAYDASRVVYESGGRSVPFHQRIDDPFHGRRMLDCNDFAQEVDCLFEDYEMVVDRTKDTVVIRLSFDRVQQNVAYAFPTVLLVRSSFQGPVRYRIVADELPATVEGELTIGKREGFKEVRSELEAASEPTAVISAPEDGLRRESGQETADGTAVPCQPHAKPMLTIEQQIAHLRQQGVTFNLCGEHEASEYLRNGNNYLRTRSYRVLYPCRPDGTYVGLDFGDLAALSSLDRRLRLAFLGACVDIEHFAKMRVLERAEEEGEDGYAIVSDFTHSLNHSERGRVIGSIRVRGGDDERHDAYSGDLIAHYLADMPLWVLLEVLEFGPFVNLYLFCAERWSDEDMRQQHYVLKSVKALRNACAHNAVTVNGLSASARQTGKPSNLLVLESLTEHGVRNTKSRRAKLGNLRMAQMTSTLYALSAFCARENTLAHHARSFREVERYFEEVRPLCPADGSLASYFDFLWRLVDIWLPERAE
jgi:abortive infection bacteriophage resistance protein